MGTVHSASAQVVKNTIVKLLKISNATNLSVKRKLKDKRLPEQEGFVLHDDEEMLQALDTKWVSVSLQTGWRLEQCMKPVHCTDKASSNPNLSLVGENNEVVPVVPPPTCQSTTPSPALVPSNSDSQSECTSEVNLSNPHNGHVGHMSASTEHVSGSSTTPSAASDSFLGSLQQQ